MNVTAASSRPTAEPTLRNSVGRGEGAKFLLNRTQKAFLVVGSTSGSTTHPHDFAHAERCRRCVGSGPAFQDTLRKRLTWFECKILSA